MHIPESVIPNELSEKLPSTPRYVDTSSASLIPRSPNTVIVDLRRQEDYQTHHIPGSENVPVVESKDWEPFSDAKVLETLWLKLEATFEATSEIGKKMEQHRSKPILLLCYNGNNARVAASVLRAKGFEADCVRGGFRSLDNLQQNQTVGPPSLAKTNGHVHVQELAAGEKPYLRLA